MSQHRQQFPFHFTGATPNVRIGANFHAPAPMRAQAPRVRWSDGIGTAATLAAALASFICLIGGVL